MSEENFGDKIWKNPWLLRGLMIFFLLFLIFYVGRLSHKGMSFNVEQCYELHDGWEYISYDGTNQKISVPFQLEENMDSGIRISRILPERDGMVANSICLWAGMRSIAVYLDDSLYYEYRNETDYGKVEGIGWIIVRLPQDWEGRKLTLEITSPYLEYAGAVKTILLGTKASILFEILERNGINLLISGLLIFMGLVILIASILLKKLLMKDRGFLYLGWFQIWTGLWLFAESGTTQFIMNNSLIVDTLTYVSLLAVPVPLLIYLGSHSEYHAKKAVNLLAAVHVFTAVTVVFLQVFDIKTMYEMIPLTHILLMISALVITITIFREAFLYKNKSLLFLGYSCLLLGGSGILEMLAYYSGSRFMVGYYFRIGIVLCMVYITAIVIRKSISMIRLSSEANYYEKLALLDFMTQCQNRTAYQKELEKQDRRIHEKESIAVVLTDLNNLKQMNDSLGHHMGDAAIKLCGKLILQVFRDLGICYRIGGDEFVCLLYNCREKLVREKVQEFKDLCEAENREWDNEFGAAIGYAFYDRKTDHCLEDTMKRADRNMYEDKHSMKKARQERVQEAGDES